MPELFAPLTLQNIELKNRIAMSPMCMYAATTGGYATDWHHIHYPARAIGQVGLVMFEATAVEARGRISGTDLGIWEDAQVEGLAKTVRLCKQYGAATAIQLAHAGRKAKGDSNPPISCTDLPFNTGDPAPVRLDQTEIAKVVEAFGQGAKRAAEAGFDIVEIHGAHGYLINQFLSPISNQRTDAYGGNSGNRMRFLKEVIAVVKANFKGPVLVRLSAVDHVPGGVMIEDTIDIVNHCKNDIELWDLSSGGATPMRIKPWYGYQVPYAQAVKQQTGCLTGAVGQIKTADMAAEIIANERADLVFLGRALLENPHWPIMAAKHLGVKIDIPKTYISIS
jgi:NADPH2 dehydrogenase